MNKLPPDPREILSKLHQVGEFLIADLMRLSDRDFLIVMSKLPSGYAAVILSDKSVTDRCAALIRLNPKLHEAIQEKHIALDKIPFNFQTVDK